MDKKTETELKNTLVSLQKGLERQNSLAFAIVKGLMYGVGTIIGATLFGGIILTILFQTFHSLEEIPLIRTLMERNNFVETIEQTQQLRSE